MSLILTTEHITQIQVILSIGRDLSRKSHGGLYIHCMETLKQRRKQHDSRSVGQANLG